MAYLINFIKTGNPNGEGLAEWTPYNKSKKFMVFDENPTRMGKPERLRLLKNTLLPMASACDLERLLLFSLLRAYRMDSLQQIQEVYDIYNTL